MPDFDAIVIGAGHNGLAAASILQRGGMRTLCLEKNHYIGGMASTVELFDGYQFEIAGSVLFPLADEIYDDLGIGSVPTIDTEVMSVNIGTPDDEPVVFYSDPERLMNHIAERHGSDAVMGMAELIGWTQAPARAIGRFDVRSKPKTLDEMFACATNEAERRAINELLFGSCMDVIGRYLPDKDKHKMLRGLLAFLAVNSTYRGPYTPGSAACLAFGLAAPPNTRLMKKLEGGIGALVSHLETMFVGYGGEIRLKSKVKRIVLDGRRVAGVELQTGEVITAAVVLSNLDPSVTLTQLVDPAHLPQDMVDRLTRVDHRAAYVQMHFALSGLPEYAPPYDFLNDPSLQANVGVFGSPEEMQRDWENCRRGVVPEDPSLGLQIPTIHDPDLAPDGCHAASAFAFYFPVEVDRSQHGRLKDEMAERVIAKLTRLAPNFRDLIVRHTTFASFHMETMFGCPGGDFCHGLIHPDLLGAFRPGPRGWVDMTIPIDGLYLCGAGCYGGPGVTFIPGYNAGYEALAHG